MTFGSNKMCIIRRAVKRDIGAVKKLADGHRHELGFVMRPALEESIKKNEMFIAKIGNHIVGFVDFHQRRDRQITLYHIVVSKGQQLQGVGTALVDTLRDEGKREGVELILLKCPVDLSANIFYEAYGFRLTQTLNGRRRPLNVWCLSLST